MEQEIEFEATKVDPRSRITFTTEGRDIATVLAADDRLAAFHADIKMTAGDARRGVVAGG